MSLNELEIHPDELKTRLDSGESLLLLDVRNPWEHETARIEGSTLIPLQALQSRLDELDPDSEIIAYCHTGKRSLIAAQFMSQAGFKAVSLHGGIDLWAVQIDTSVSRY